MFDVHMVEYDLLCSLFSLGLLPSMYVIGGFKDDQLFITYSRDE